MHHEVEHSSDRLGTSLLLLVLAGAVAFRLYLLLAWDFPINDGALFVEFVRGIGRTFPGLPHTVTYNGLSLPFAYPPLPFWVGALLTKLGGDDLSVVRVVPILLNIPYVLLFALVLLKSGRSRLFTALTILFFSLTLRSFEWLVMGGGLSRGLGAVFLMLTLLAAGLPEQNERKSLPTWRLIASGVTVALATLSHLEWGILAAASFGLSRLLSSRSVKEFFVSSVISGATALLLILPWLLLIHRTHGLAPFLSAASASEWSLKMPIVRLLEVAIFSTRTNPLVLVGGLVLLIRRQWFWIGFTVLCAVLTPRHAPTPLVLPVAVYAAQGIITTYGFAARLIPAKPRRDMLALAALVMLLVSAVYWSTVHSSVSFRALPEQTREAMAWVAKAHPGKRFAIVDELAWQYDPTGEWFPTLASAQSITTVQGREWNGEFLKWDEMSKALKRSRTCFELHKGLEAFGPYDFVWAEWMHECFAAPAYRVVFRNSNVTIYEPLGKSKVLPAAQVPEPALVGAF